MGQTLSPASIFGSGSPHSFSESAAVMCRGDNASRVCEKSRLITRAGVTEPEKARDVRDGIQEVSGSGVLVNG